MGAESGRLVRELALETDQAAQRMAIATSMTIVSCGPMSASKNAIG
ncbi:MAG TPA: hypothetical protein VM616_02385 [Gammaproteobacteria bacterium]|nr:hypothetical protein [Gammaproteobacteria bacterium]